MSIGVEGAGRQRGPGGDGDGNVGGGEEAIGRTRRTGAGEEHAAIWSFRNASELRGEDNAEDGAATPRPAVRGWAVEISIVAHYEGRERSGAVRALERNE